MYAALFALSAFWYHVLFHGRIEKIAEISFSEVNNGTYRVALCAFSIVTAVWLSHDLFVHQQEKRLNSSRYQRAAKTAGVLIVILLNVPVSLFFTWRFIPVTVIDAQLRLKTEYQSALNNTREPEQQAGKESKQGAEIATGSIDPLAPLKEASADKAPHLPPVIPPVQMSKPEGKAAPDTPSTAGRELSLEHTKRRRKPPKVEVELNLFQKLALWIDEHSRPTALDKDDLDHIRP